MKLIRRLINYLKSLFDFPHAYEVDEDGVTF